MDIAKIRKRLKDQRGLKVKSQDQKDLQTEEQALQEDTSLRKTEEASFVKKEETFEKDSESVQKELSTKVTLVDSQLIEPEIISQKIHDVPESPVMSDDRYAKVSETVNLLVYKLAGEEYAFMLEDVKEILRKQFITPVPRAPYSVIGITSLRGTVIPVIDLSMKLLGIPSRRERTSRIIIIEGKQGTVGCMVDRIEGVLRAGDDQKRTLPENMTDKDKAFIDAIFIINGRFITLLKKEVIELNDDKKEPRL